MTEHRQTTRPDDHHRDPLDRGAWEASAMNGEAWDPYAEGPPPPRTGRVNLSVLFVLIDALRTALPDGVRQQFTAVVREMLLTLRSLIDWYLERLDGGPRRPKVEDIPLD